MQTLRQLYERACRWRGKLDFFADEHERVDGVTAWRSSGLIAASLIRHGMSPGERVAFLCKPSARHALAWFAAPLAGGVSCSMHIRETPDRLAETLSWLEARLLVHDPDLSELASDVLARAQAAGHRARKISLGEAGSGSVGWSDLVAEQTTDPLSVPLEPDSLAAIILSSGSTGRPKGVMHTHHTLVENA